jgi:3-oxoacid CoA-transferase subunit A
LSKVLAHASDGVRDIPDGSSIAVGGFGSCGIPSVLIEELIAHGVRGLHIVSNNCGTDGWGLGRLLEAGQIARLTASYVGENEEFVRRYLGGQLETELIPQGTLAERLRAGGAGIPAFFSPAGLGTVIAEGGLPWRYDERGEVVVASPAKRVETFEGREYVLEHGLVTDYALVRAWKADVHGNLVFRKSARNFNPLCAMAGRVTVVEAEHVVAAGELDPDEIHLPGIFVQAVVAVPADAEKRIDKLTTKLEEVSA